MALKMTFCGKMWKMRMMTVIVKRMDDEQSDREDSISVSRMYCV
jgi:hypothetical protein